MAGGEVRCGGCGAVTVAPFDLPCEDDSAVPEAETLTLAQMQALKQARG
jgi:hypothetical protein